MRYITPAYRWTRDSLEEIRPFLLTLVLVSIMTAMFIVVQSSFDAQRDAKKAARDAAQTANNAAKTAGKALTAVERIEDVAKTNRDILDRLNPCLPGDAPELPRCIRETEDEVRVADALRKVQEQHDAQDRKLEIIEQKPIARASPTSSRTTTNTTGINQASKTTTTTQTSPNTTSTPITTPTTTCPPKGKNKCK